MPLASAARRPFPSVRARTESASESRTCYSPAQALRIRDPQADRHVLLKIFEQSAPPCVIGIEVSLADVLREPAFLLGDRIEQSGTMKLALGSAIQFIQPRERVDCGRLACCKLTARYRH